MIFKSVCFSLLFLAVASVETYKHAEFSVLYLTGINEQYYVTNISVGTPPQIFTVGFSNQVDTTFVPSITCHTCKAVTFFDSTKSTTFSSTGATIGIMFTNPQKTIVSGNYCFDTINLGGYNIQHQLFADIVREVNYDFPFDGVVGLNFDEYSFISNMASQGLIDAPVLGYFINKNLGEISFGAPNPEHFSGNLNYFNLTGPTWSLSLDNYTISGGQSESISNITQLAVFDVGVQNIQSGIKTIKEINEALGAKLQDDGSYVFDCDTLDQNPAFTFIFNSQAFTLQPQDYTQMIDSKCVSYFVTSSFWDDSVFSIGQPFFRKFYTVFDFGNQRIAFAESK